MAFRKTIRSNYEPPMHFGGFAEPKMVSKEDGSGVSVMKLEEVPVEKLCDQALPMFGLEVIKQTGKVISGNVSFAPTDPTDFNEVQDVVGDYVSRVKPVLNENPVDPPVDSVDPVDPSTNV